MVHGGRGSGGVGGFSTSSPDEEQQEWNFLSLPLTYTCAYTAVYLPLTVWGTIGWGAYVRALSRPPPVPGSTADLVLGKPVQRFRDEWQISRKSWSRFSLSYLADLLEGLGVFPSYAIATLAEAILAHRRGQQSEQEEGALSLTWGCVIGGTLTYPLSILAYQVKSDAWQGWKHLLPITPLGRSYWRALPVKLVDNVCNLVIQNFVREEFARYLGASTEFLGWLAPEPKDENVFEEEENLSTLQTIGHRFRSWALTFCSYMLGTVATIIIQLPIHALFYRMMGNPGRFSSVVDCARHIWTNEGLAGFYRELPLYLSFMLVTAI